ncbi:MAG: L-serine ammonia-lyase, iron-sulfur-dependent, subunit alpha [Coriobacteriia bacterium]|nr:L-serine ammonia-lyase, iron-sulfur-dependent, subunit alpha [Coriobacteriia bacterium]
MSQISAFEVLGPVMIGPSSSHTAGALRIALLARSLVSSNIKHVHFILYNSFARTHNGHGTDRALLAGILGMQTDDYDIKRSFEIADECGLSYEFTYVNEGEGLHPNTVDILITDESENTLKIRGVSRGGGRIMLTQINGIDVDLRGDLNTLFVSHYDRPGVLAETSSCIAEFGINIAFMRSYRQTRGGKAYTIFEVDDVIDDKTIDAIKNIDNVLNAASVVVPGAITVPGSTVECDFISGAELLELTEKLDKKISGVMYQREVNLTEEKLAQDKMWRVLKIMKEETHYPIEHPEKSLGGLIGGESQKVFQSLGKYKGFLSPLSHKAVAYAMAVLERSATMGLIVAAPTAGASGIVPGCLIAAQEEFGFSDQEIFDALYTAAALGYLFTRNASVSGAEGGCQAETGSAGAMAAAALVELMGGSPAQSLQAASIAIANSLGLVCDPIAGLVEAPCQMRNASMVSSAIAAALLALSGATSPVPFDETAEVMLRVGKALPTSLRETAEGGLAQAPSAIEACRACGICS